MPTIQDGRQAIEQGNLQQARLIFEAILQENKRDEDAWLGLAEVLTDDDDKRICYDNVLKINKNNRAAKEGLRNLEPQANPFVDMLRQKDDTLLDDEDEDNLADETLVSTRMAETSALLADTDTPNTPLLVALGLILSVVMFALLSGVIYVTLSTLAG
jgi:thioredoxin-like negative regulator of GroEL